jgi:hypothetical protein
VVSGEIVDTNIAVDLRKCVYNNGGGGCRYLVVAE